MLTDRQTNIDRQVQPSGTCTQRVNKEGWVKTWSMECGLWALPVPALIVVLWTAGLWTESSWQSRLSVPASYLFDWCDY